MKQFGQRMFRRGHSNASQSIWRSSIGHSKSKQSLTDEKCASVPNILQRHFMIMTST